MIKILYLSTFTKSWLFDINVQQDLPKWIVLQSDSHFCDFVRNHFLFVIIVPGDKTNRHQSNNATFALLSEMYQ